MGINNIKYLGEQPVIILLQIRERNGLIIPNF